MDDVEIRFSTSINALVFSVFSIAISSFLIFFLETGISYFSYLDRFSILLHSIEKQSLGVFKWFCIFLGYLLDGRVIFQSNCLSFSESTLSLVATANIPVLKSFSRELRHVKGMALEGPSYVPY